MGSIIDNREKTMLSSLKEALAKAGTVDIMTAFFYFSGFNALAENLKDKKIRILVGNTIDPAAIADLRNAIIDGRMSLESFVSRKPISGHMLRSRHYTESFIEIFNKSVLADQFDEPASQKVFEMFLNKLSDGSLQIKLTGSPSHGKFFLLDSPSAEDSSKGTLLMGSSNFTYNGLIGQGEINEELSQERMLEYRTLFEREWEDGEAVNISTIHQKERFIQELREKLWIFALPSPYMLFMRILHELYSAIDECNAISPARITEGKYCDFIYQTDAIRHGIECVRKNSGVIIADVVGLGKSIIAAAIAHNLDMRKTIIIAPPHLKEQWEEYLQDFGLRGAIVHSSGMIEEVHKAHAQSHIPTLFIIDEAHRYRNEMSDTYIYLRQLTRSNAENKVILLTATPYNNRPQDLLALIKLFQTPSRSTICAVDNIGARFQILISQYNRIQKEGKKGLTDNLREKLADISRQLRMLIDPVLVRRSRIDLCEIKEYADDLAAQGIEFPQVEGPMLLQYDLGIIKNLYLSTLSRISNEFKCARYNAASKLLDVKAFKRKYGKLFDEADIELFQRNLSTFFRRLLVMRFESSKEAFRSTLDTIIRSYQTTKRWWKKGYVFIKRHGQLPDPDVEDLDDIVNALENMEDDESSIDELKNSLKVFSRDLFSDEFIAEVDEDLALLTKIREEWIQDKNASFDPKFEEVKKQLTELLRQDGKRKIVIFTSFADTAKYVHDLLRREGYRVLLFVGGASKKERMIVKQNFDASHSREFQQDDYDIIVATDALSEGFNLNRAGVVINYDIPYNPTRVVQRIGRINRINRKMFDKIYIYNLFPTEIGEKDTYLKGISTLKMLLINEIVGSDTRTLTPDETLQSYFKRQYLAADLESSERSWDNEYRNIYYLFKNDLNMLQSAIKIPERVRLARKGRGSSTALLYAKKGDNNIFVKTKPGNQGIETISAQEALSLLSAKPEEEAYELDQNGSERFLKLSRSVFAQPQELQNSKKKAQAISQIEMLLRLCPAEKNYLSDLLTVVKIYEDLSDGELRAITKLAVNKSNVHERLAELKKVVSEHYVMQIKQKAESIGMQDETILFMEDFQSANE